MTMIWVMAVLASGHPSPTRVGHRRAYLDGECPSSLWCFTTVAAAIALARLVERPASSSLSLMCSYIRCSLSLTLGRCCFLGIGRLLYASRRVLGLRRSDADGPDLTALPATLGAVACHRD